MSYRAQDIPSEGSGDTARPRIRGSAPPHAYVVAAFVVFALAVLVVAGAVAEMAT